MNNSRSVLYVDDDVEACELTGMLLAHHGIQVDTRRTAEEAMLIMATYPLVILDFDLGRGLNGLDLARSYKASRPSGLVVLVTGHEGAGFGPDVDLRVLKPLNLDEFVANVIRGLDSGSFLLKTG